MNTVCKLLVPCALLAFSACAASDTRSGELAPIVEGRFVWGAEVFVLRPCGDSLTYWVATSDSTSRQLRTAHESLATQAYQEIFVRVRGALSDGPRGEFAREYDGLFRIDTVLAVTSEVPRGCVHKERQRVVPTTR